MSATYLLPMDGEPILDGAMAVELGTIRAIGPRPALIQQYPHASLREFPKQVILPGLINAHCHIDLTDFICQPSTERPHYSGQEEGLTPTTSPHLDWLIQATKFRQQIPLEQLVAGIRRGLRQLIQAGTTCAGLVSGYDGIAALLEEAGLRAVLFPEIFASGPGDRAQDRFESALALLEEHEATNPSHLRIGLGPMAPYVLSRHLLRIISQHAKTSAIPLQVHAAESFAEMEFFFDSTGPIGTQLFPALGWGPSTGGELPPAFHKTPIQYLSEIGFLDAAPSIVGAIHLGDRDFTTLARSLCRTIYCPRANRVFGHGEFPLNKFTEYGIAVGIGTESTLQTADGNLWEELRTAMDTAALSPKALLHMATIGSARALGWEHHLGSLTPGKAADFIVCDLPPNTELPLLYDAIVRHTTPGRVRATVVGGQWLKTG